jgi:hypothetical protein
MPSFEIFGLQEDLFLNSEHWKVFELFEKYFELLIGLAPKEQCSRLRN